MCCDIILLILGVVILVKGQVLLTRNKEVRGVPARMIGVLFLLPLPLSFLAGLLLGAFYVSQGKTVVNETEIRGTATVLGGAIIVLCLLAAFVIAIVYAQPVRKRRRDDEEEVDMPDRYDEHFQADEESRPRPRSDNPDVTDLPPRPSARPDDRIHD